MERGLPCKSLKLEKSGRILIANSWSFSATVDWPLGGEIDIIEGIHTNTNNQAVSILSDCRDEADAALDSSHWTEL